MSDLNKYFDDNIYCILKSDQKKDKKLYVTEDNTAVKIKDTDYSEETLKLLILCYSQDEINVSSETEKNIVADLNKEELEVFAQNLFDIWILNKCDIRKKWIVKFSAHYGGEKVVRKISRQIEKWIKDNKIYRAVDGIIALSLNDSIDAFKWIERIWIVSNNKEIQKAAEDAIEFASDRLNIDKDIFLDKIISSLNLNNAGIYKISCNEKQYYIYLVDLFRFKIYNDNNVVKKNKDIEKNLKEIRRQLEKVTYRELSRLEKYIGNNRRWKTDEWIEVFIKNPVMRTIGSKFIWGIYSKNKVIRMIKYDFNILNSNVCINSLEYKNNAVLNHKNIDYLLDKDKNNDLYFIIDEIDRFVFKDKNNIKDYEINLMHPVDMIAKHIAIWKDYFEKLNILQPVDQLYRQTFKISEDEHDKVYIDKFLGKIINSKTLSVKMNRYGWYKGGFSKDGLSYGFYKENFNLKIAAELNVQRISVNSKDIKVYLLKFYKISKSKKEKFEFDNVNKEDILKVYEVPRRFFSEVMYEINNSLLESIKTDYTCKEDINFYL